jgi:restriction system protein
LLDILPAGGDEDHTTRDAADPERLGLRMTIIEAIKRVMHTRRGAMTAQEAHDAIVEADLYTFNAENPVGVVASQIRRHCRGLDFPSASETKHFELRENGKYYFLPNPVTHAPARDGPLAVGTTQRSLLKELTNLHKKYDDEVRRGILSQIKKLDPRTFEVFSKRLLEAYGFLEVEVTRYCKDGGIDGSGKLKVGLAHLNVAFQCKRYTNGTVGRGEIDSFRGAIQGQYEQGIFFTSSRFAHGAESISFRPGAVPIILIDGKAIVDIMIDKRFGIQVEMMPVYSYALDLALSNEDQ